MLGASCPIMGELGAVRKLSFFPLLLPSVPPACSGTTSEDFEDFGCSHDLREPASLLRPLLLSGLGA